MFKKISTLLFMVFTLNYASAQGLEHVLVEKIAVQPEAISADNNLNANTFTYRVFIDMAPGYKLSNVVGTVLNPLIFKTTTQFYNDNVDGDMFPLFRPRPLNTEPLYYDSWVTIGSYGKNNALTQLVPLSEDTDGIADGFMGVPLTSTTAIDPATDLELFFGYDMGPSADGSTTGWDPENVIYYNVDGVSGAGTSNSVCIGQFTTDGEFSMEVPVRLISEGLPSEHYVIRSNHADDMQLSNELSYPNNPPSVSITAPSAGQGFEVNELVTITADPQDSDGTISRVIFQVNDSEVRTVTEAPYTIEWQMPDGGEKTIRVIVVDSKYARDSAEVKISGNSFPVVSILSPANSSEFENGVNVEISASAEDSDGQITKVEFFVNGEKIGEDNTSPYSINWTSVAGVKDLTAVATDNLGSATLSDAVTITVTVPGNMDPLVTLSQPVNNILVTSGDSVLISADASDPDAGDMITKVEFYINGDKIGEATSAPYQVYWKSIGNGEVKVTAVSYDSKGGKATSSERNINLNLRPATGITNPADAAVLPVKVPVVITTDAADADGTVEMVEFFADGVKLGEDLSFPFSYSWTPGMVGNVVLFVVATDNLGAERTSATLTVQVTPGVGLENVMAEKTEMLVYPNPFNSVVNVSINHSGEVRYTVADITGKTLKSGVLHSDNQNIHTIDLSDLNSGIYFIRAFTDDRSWIQLRKLIKSRD